MKIGLNLNGPLRGLKQHIIEEGDEVVGVGDVPVSIPEPVRLPESVVEIMLGDVNVTKRENYFLTRWFDGEEFLEQTFAGVTLDTLMNDDLGPRVTTAVGGGYVQVSSERTLRYFESPILRTALKQANLRGPISLLMHDADVVTVYQGVPHHGLYAILEGREGRIERAYAEPSPMKESYVAALLVTRPPFPHRGEVKSTPIDSITPSLLKHCYLLDCTKFRGTYISHSAEVAIVTAWSTRSWRDCGRRVLHTASQIGCPEKQYRTDIVEAIQNKWNMLTTKQLFKSVV